MRNTLLISLFATLSICICAVSVTAQSSVGFEDPDDVQALLDYRLPTWGYHVWDLGLSLGGNGDGGPEHYERLAMGTNSGYEMYRESEENVLQVTGDYTGSYTYMNDDRREEGKIARSTAWSLSGRVLARHYLHGDLALEGSLNTGGTYSDYNPTDSFGGERRIRRRFNYDAYLGPRWGRMRDVTPLLRAARISERLTALGRDRLSPAEIRRLAEILASHSGYTAVFDRHEKVFWSDVFETLAGDKPLTPYEVLYLSEVLAERIGYRTEGWYAGIFASSDRRTNNPADQPTTSGLGTLVKCGWSHNLNLEQQLAFYASGSYSWGSEADSDANRGTASVSLQHLWALADRIIWTNSNRWYFEYREHDYYPEIGRVLNGLLSSAFDFYVEDNVSITPSVSLRLTETRMGTESSLEKWSWQFGVGVNYLFDNSLL